MRQSRWKEFLFLVRREFLFQLDGRKAYPRGVYPGVNWFALLCIGALLLEYSASRQAPEISATATDHFIFLIRVQAFLIALRSSVYCALSMSRDLQNHTATVVRVSPVSRTATLTAKLCACLAPLWVELILFLPVALLFFSVYLWLPPLLVASATVFLMAVSLLSGCLGLAVGSAAALPSQAARNARVLVVSLLFLVPILHGMSGGWMLPLIAMGVWLSATTRKAPHRVGFLMTFGSLVMAMGLLHSAGPAGFSLYGLHPLLLPNDFYSVAMSTQSFLPMGNAAMGHPLAISGVYLVLASILFLLARTRYRHAR